MLIWDPLNTKHNSFPQNSGICDFKLQLVDASIQVNGRQYLIYREFTVQQSRLFVTYERTTRKRNPFKHLKMDVINFICTILNQHKLTKEENLRGSQIGIILTT